MGLKNKSKKYRKGLEKNNRFNFNKILNNIIINNGEIGEIEAILLLEPNISGDYFEMLDVAKEYINDLLDFEGVKKVLLPMHGYKKVSIPYFKLDLEKYDHLKGLPIKMYDKEIKDLLIKNYNTKKASI